MPDPINALPPTHADLQANAYNDALSHVVGGAPLSVPVSAPTCVDCGQSTGQLYDGDYSHKSPRHCIEILKLALAAANRSLTNLYQDSCEGALVPVSLLDDVKRALSEVAPDHPALTAYTPSYGVWQRLSTQLAAATQDAARWRAVRAHFVAFQVDHEGVGGSVVLFDVPECVTLTPLTADPDHYADQLVARECAK